MKNFHNETAGVIWRVESVTASEFVDRDESWRLKPVDESREVIDTHGSSSNRTHAVWRQFFSSETVQRSS